MSEHVSHRASTPEDEASEARATSEGFGHLSIEDDAEGHSPESRAWFARIRQEEEEAMRRDGHA